MNIPGVRSPYDLVGGIVYFGRMLDKIRLNVRGELPPDYQENLGGGFDLRCCRFLGVAYDAIRKRTLDGGTDEQILEWCHENGRGAPDDEQIEMWNDFMRKRGWRDTGTDRLKSRLEEIGATNRTDIQTMFDFIELDEGRDPAK
jgi:gluconokinase